jgi:hypothetical protein
MYQLSLQILSLASFDQIMHHLKAGGNKVVLRKFYDQRRPVSHHG